MLVSEETGPVTLEVLDWVVTDNKNSDNLCPSLTFTYSTQYENEEQPIASLSDFNEIRIKSAVTNINLSVHSSYYYSFYARFKVVRTEKDWGGAEVNLGYCNGHISGGSPWSSSLGSAMSAYVKNIPAGTTRYLDFRLVDARGYFDVYDSDLTLIGTATNLNNKDSIFPNYTLYRAEIPTIPD